MEFRKMVMITLARYFPLHQNQSSVYVVKSIIFTVFFMLNLQILNFNDFPQGKGLSLNKSQSNLLCCREYLAHCRPSIYITEYINGH